MCEDIALEMARIVREAIVRADRHVRSQQTAEYVQWPTEEEVCAAATFSS